MHVILRSEAKQLGLKRYYTGKACKHGHLTERFTNDGKCRECSRIDPSRQKFKEKEAERSKKKRLIAKLNKPIKIKKSKEQLSREAVLRTNKWRENNQDRSNALSRICYQKNKENKKKTKKAWRDKNKIAIRFLTAQRRALQKNALPKWSDKKKVRNLYLNCPKGYCVDHIVPLQSKFVCGLHNHFNLQYLTRSENSQKSNIWWPDMP